jgi:hypothetical protein
MQDGWTADNPSREVAAMPSAAIPSVEQEQTATHGPRRHRRGRGIPHRVPEPATRLESPPIVTVFRRPEGGIFHAWCQQPLQFQGQRARLELDFYCFRCMEHVALPEQVLPRIPVRHAAV